MRKYLKKSTEELRALAEDNREDVLVELSYRARRPAKRLLAELLEGNDTPEPLPEPAQVADSVEGENRPCPPCGGRGGFAGGFLCRTCSGTGRIAGSPKKWRVAEIYSNA